MTHTYINGWLSSVTGSGGATYASAITYHPNGMLKKLTQGNGVALNIGLDPDYLLRPASFFTTGAGTSNWSSRACAYDDAGNVTRIGTSHFTCDHVSRLKTAEVQVEPTSGLPFSDGFESGDFTCWAPGSCMTPGQTYSQSFTYEAFGNLEEVVGANGRTTPTSSLTNRLTEASYDVMGNVLTWNGDTYEYDALGMMTRRCPGGCVAGAADWRFLYTAGDERLWFNQVTQGAVGGNVWTLRDLDGSTLRQYDAIASWAARDYVYRDGQLLASNFPGEGDRHFDLDHLGTPRLITNSAGQKVAYHSYLPFGEEVTAGAQDAERRKFTGHERDTMGTADVADDRDNMHARQYSALLGRFLSVDVGQVDLRHPQSLCRYCYVSGNPLTFIDPRGMSAEPAPAGMAPEDVSTDVTAAEGMTVSTWRFAPGPNSGLRGLRSLTSARAFLDSLFGEGFSDRLAYFKNYPSMLSLRGLAEYPVFMDFVDVSDEVDDVVEPGMTLWESALPLPACDIPAALGYGVTAGRYARAGGGGVTLLKDGKRIFGIDYHKFKFAGRMMKRIHFHAGKTASQIAKHRPWQGGWRWW